MIGCGTLVFTNLRKKRSFLIYYIYIFFSLTLQKLYVTPFILFFYCSQQTTLFLYVCSEPLIIDTQGQMSSYSREDIVNKFQSLRGADGISGPPMYIVSNDYVEILHDSSYHESSNNKWIPSFTRLTPERVVLSRICALANQSYQYIMKAMMNSKSTEINAWKGIFQENPSSMKSYSFLLRVNTDFVVDSGCSSSSSDFGLLNSVHLGFETPYTRTLIKRLLGPKQLRKKAYKNLNSQTAKDGIMVST